MGQVMKNLDILRLSVTFLAFATVVFILATSWTVFHSQGDQASCQKLLESAREIKDSLRQLNLDEEKLSRDLETVHGQKSELLRAILESDLEGSSRSKSMHVFNNGIHDHYRILPDSGLIDGPSNSGEETRGFRETGNLKVCVFGRQDLASPMSRDVRCPRLNSTVRLVESLDVRDVQSAEVTLFRDTQQKFGWWQALLKERKKHQRWGLLSMVPPTSSAKYTSLPKAFRSATFHWTVTYNNGSDIPLPFGVYRESEDEESGESPDFSEKNKLVAYIASDCDQEKWPRQRFVAMLQTYVDVEVFGCVSCGSSCRERLREFKFILALESTPCGGYITEVFWSALSEHQSVPIVWGAQPEDYRRVAPENSYIEVSQFESVQQLARYVKDLAESPNKYREFHAWRESGTTDVLLRMKDIHNVPYDSHVCSVVDKYINGYGKDAPFRDTNRNDWLGSCSIRPYDVLQDLPIPAESEEV